MLALEITPWHWGGFIGCVLLFLAWDLGIWHRNAQSISLKEALGWTVLWIALALLFAAALVPLRGKREALEFFTGYFIELSLSMDNIFVIALVFTYFRLPVEYQHRVLFWGILGALLMRGMMIWLGVELITRFDWLLYVFGAFLLLTGFRMLLSKEGMGVDPEKSIIVRVARKLFPISPNFDGQNFTTRLAGRRMLTPLFLVLLVVETSDLIFAVDSIPAVFGVTRKPFIVFTSNVFAILGLRSMYFLLAGALGLFRYLKIGLSVVLILIGLKMLLDPHERTPAWYQIEVPTTVALALVILIIAASILVSIIATRREKMAAAAQNNKPPGPT